MKTNNNNEKGKFIVVEGIDGAGKTTTCHHLVDALKSHCIPVIFTNEPGGTELGRMIKNIFRSSLDIEPEAELLMIQAARAQHIKTVLLPAIEKGTWIVCDRYTLSTIVYQGLGRKLGQHNCPISRHLLPCLLPDFTIILDLPVAEAKKRMAARGEASDRFEKMGSHFFEVARDFYYRHGKLDLGAPSPRVLVDANRPPDEVNASAIHKLERHFDIELIEATNAPK